MKNRKMIRKMISNKDEAIGSDFKPYILSNTITKLCIFINYFDWLLNIN